MRHFLESVGSFFSGGVQRRLPSSAIEFVGPGAVIDPNDPSEEALIRLCWALVHSSPPGKVKQGITKLEESMPNTNNPMQKRKKLYLLGVGYYHIGNLSKSKELLEQCLQIDQPLILSYARIVKKRVEDRIRKDHVNGIRIIVTTVGVIAGGIVAALFQRNGFNLLQMLTTH